MTLEAASCCALAFTPNFLEQSRSLWALPHGAKMRKEIATPGPRSTVSQSWVEQFHVTKYTNLQKYHIKHYIDIYIYR